MIIHFENAIMKYTLITVISEKNVQKFVIQEQRDAE